MRVAVRVRHSTPHPYTENARAREREREITTIVEAVAVVGAGGVQGPFLIKNNYLEAAAENLMFGGGDPAIA